MKKRPSPQPLEGAARAFDGIELSVVLGSLLTDVGDRHGLQDIDVPPEPDLARRHTHLRHHSTESTVTQQPCAWAKAKSSAVTRMEWLPMMLWQMTTAL